MLPAWMWPDGVVSPVRTGNSTTARSLLTSITFIPKRPIKVPSKWSSTHWAIASGLRSAGHCSILFPGQVV